MHELFNLKQITQAIMVVSPKTSNPKDIALNYFNHTRAALIKGFHLATEDQINQDILPVSFSQLRHQCGKFGPRGHQQYWFDWFQENYPLMTQVQRGHKVGKTGILTMVKSIIDLDILLAANEPKAIVRAYYQDFADLPDSSIDWAPIDQQSLEAYILANNSVEARNKEHQATLAMNQKQAKLIQSIASVMNNQLPQVINWSLFGRKYYRGPNLQSVSRVVRHAALGDCYQYDIESSVFAWKLHEYHQHYEHQQFYATERYLENKSKFRQRIAHLLFGNDYERTIKTVKQLITAIGFGARATNAVWREENGQWRSTSLGDIIHSTEKLKLFLEDAWVKEFINEQTHLNKAIFNANKENLRDHKEIQNARGQLSINKTVSWLYQHKEAEVMAILEAEFSQYEILLRCHDAIYTKKSVPLAELRALLQKHITNGRIDQERHRAWRFQDNQEIIQHQTAIRQEELQAMQYAERLGQPYVNPVVDEYKTESTKKYEDFDSGYWDENKHMEHYDIRNDLHYEGYSELELQQLEKEFYPQQTGLPNFIQELLIKTNK